MLHVLARRLLSNRVFSEYCFSTMGEKIPFFDFSAPERLEEFLEDMVILMASKAITSEEQKRGILIRCLCEETKRKVREWVHPLTLPECPYNRLLEVLRENVQPSVNRDVQFNSLVTRFQQEGESGAAYCAELERLSMNLGFTREDAKLLVLFQFKRGLRDHSTQVKLYGDPTISLDGAKTTAKAAESSKACISSLQQHVEVHAMHSARKQVNFNKQQTVSKTVKTPVSSEAPSANQISCFRCGESGHITKQCSLKYKDCHCSNCGKIGHLLAACKRAKKQKEEVSINNMQSVSSLAVAPESNHKTPTPTSDWAVKGSDQSVFGDLGSFSFSGFDTFF